MSEMAQAESRDVATNDWPLALRELATNPSSLRTLPGASRRRMVSQLAALIVVLESIEDGPPSPATTQPLPASEEPLLNVEAAAARMGFARSYVYELVRRGKLRAIRHGKYVRIRAAAIDEWIAENEA